MCCHRRPLCLGKKPTMQRCSRLSFIHRGRPNRFRKLRLAMSTPTSTCSCSLDTFPTFDLGAGTAEEATVHCKGLSLSLSLSSSSSSQTNYPTNYGLPLSSSRTNHTSSHPADVEVQHKQHPCSGGQVPPPPFHQNKPPTPKGLGLGLGFRVSFLLDT